MTHKILVVDDQEAIRDLLKEAFARGPYKIQIAASAEEALSLLAMDPVDVVISDEKMPGMSGTQFLAVVRKKYPDTIRIILTGHASLDTAIRAINMGEIYRFFTKPCNIVDLRVTVQHALEQKSLREENLRLQAMVATQAMSIRSLEQQCPGITEIKRDASGAIIIDE
ncbi:MAG: response regulator [Desulfobacterales bacterium]|nr:response regulator [Desulfobacterales bacterium]